MALSPLAAIVMLLAPAAPSRPSLKLAPPHWSVTSTGSSKRTVLVIWTRAVIVAPSVMVATGSPSLSVLEGVTVNAQVASIGVSSILAASPPPATFTARTSKLCVVPFTSPVTV